MFAKRPLILIVLLFAASLACETLFPNLPKNTVPVAARKDGECSDPRFKEAELAAYQAMLQARAAAADALENEISRIETDYKRNIAQLNDEYQSALQACQSADCTLAAKKKYDTSVKSQQIYQEDGIYVAQGQEQAAIEAAQVNYNAEVEEAKRLYCSAAYEASGQFADGQFTGLICSLELPFTVDVSTPFVNYPIEFTPASSGGGTYSFAWTKDVITASGSGQYTVEGLDTDSPRLALSGDSTGTIPVGTVTEGGAVTLDLTPLDTEACTQP